MPPATRLGSIHPDGAVRLANFTPGDESAASSSVDMGYLVAAKWGICFVRPNSRTPHTGRCVVRPRQSCATVVRALGGQSEVGDRAGEASADSIELEICG